MECDVGCYACKVGKMTFKKNPFAFIKSSYRFAQDLLSNRRMLAALISNDFKSRYLQNYLGILWAFVLPVATILIFWFVFQVGFKAAPIQDTPFIIWLIAGMIPWFFLSESLQSATNSVLDNTFLVKKIVFRVELLPVVKISSALIIHCFFIAVMIGIFLAYGYQPSWYWLQIAYYLLASIMLLLGLVWITSSVVIFFRDLGQIVSMLVQFFFWLTPIFWMISMVPEPYRFWFELNPVYYITQGYRDSLIDHVWFWEKPQQALYFWGMTMVALFGGALIFRK